MLGFGIIDVDFRAEIWLIHDYAKYMNPQKPIRNVSLSHCYHHRMH
jgi:hypothetical protein